MLFVLIFHESSTNVQTSGESQEWPSIQSPSILVISEGQLCKIDLLSLGWRVRPTPHLSMKLLGMVFPKKGEIQWGVVCLLAAVLCVYLRYSRNVLRTIANLMYLPPVTLSGLCELAQMNQDKESQVWRSSQALSLTCATMEFSPTSVDFEYSAFHSIFPNLVSQFLLSVTSRLPSVVLLVSFLYIWLCLKIQPLTENVRHCLVLMSFFP